MPNKYTFHFQIENAESCIAELREKLEESNSMLKPRDDKIKRLVLRNELMGEYALKHKQMHNEAIRKKEEEIARYLKELEEKNEFLKQYEVKVTISSVDLNLVYLLIKLF